MCQEGIDMNPTQHPSAIRSKNEITNTLLHLMKSFPYHEITVKQILMESHVARKTFYRNFSSKDDVLSAHIDTILYQYVQSLQQMPSCRLSVVLDIIFEFCIQNQEFLFQLRDNELLHLILNKLNRLIPLLHNQIVSPDYPLFQPFTSEQTEYIIAFNVGAAWNIILKWVEGGMREMPESIKRTILRYLNHMSHFIEMQI